MVTVVVSLHCIDLNSLDVPHNLIVYLCFGSPHEPQISCIEFSFCINLLASLWPVSFHPAKYPSVSPDRCDTKLLRALTGLSQLLHLPSVDFDAVELL